MPRQTSSFYILEVSRSVYDLVQNGKLPEYPVPLTDHLPALPQTFKDLPKNIANTLRDVAVGDTLTFHCERPTAEYGIDIEKRVTGIRVDDKNHVKYVQLERERPPAWKKR